MGVSVAEATFSKARRVVLARR